MTTALDRAPMALTEDFEVYRDAARAWMRQQTEPFNADDLRDAVPPKRPAWPGEVFTWAAKAGLIRMADRAPRPSRHPANKGSLYPVWEPVTPTTTEADCA